MALLGNTMDGMAIERSTSDGPGRKRQVVKEYQQHSRRIQREQREKGFYRGIAPSVYIYLYLA
jgi:hypothetical protein